ncbi:hypothetical protein UFOVP1028_1 [uncultured Caudovirales phage]|uniref:Uncharacterized protein n=1 Tax=uncultured Caudovirales phage TaxID=2100421 RepID=A0A6J5RDF4_9CAUD|nr:hypothetical protein UFOVP960_12 [uncultured Caudovirales phage]CAB4178761.1 hypothetical protein UFOVP1028_1 [uncultured Caudovirales phage]CAB4189434.1 hypothetical protein UFOVP1187_18 [uncultured Caudovirales phage]CAB4192427.1 hypothetical protein UFOVP1235_35 [uncultured Caudovirales phage]CAB4215825.1 hypothetical protein UFOVP1488_18 [uncultured Caudovirales phage]
MNTNDIAALIEATTTKIMDEWTAEAIAAGVDVDTYICDKNDELEDSQPDVCMAISAAHLRRLGLVTA